MTHHTPQARVRAYLAARTTAADTIACAGTVNGPCHYLSATDLANLAADVPEGCTPADARALRGVNHRHDGLMVGSNITTDLVRAIEQQRAVRIQAQSDLERYKDQCLHVETTNQQLAGHVNILREQLHKRTAELDAANRCLAARAAGITFTKNETQSSLDRVIWAQGLVEQLPAHHDGRNSWLLNYGVGDEADTLRAWWAERNGRPCFHADADPARRAEHPTPMEVESKHELEISAATPGDCDEFAGLPEIRGHEDSGEADEPPEEPRSRKDLARAEALIALCQANSELLQTSMDRGAKAHEHIHRAITLLFGEGASHSVADLAVTDSLESHV